VLDEQNAWSTVPVQAGCCSGPNANRVVPRGRRDRNDGSFEHKDPNGACSWGPGPSSTKLDRLPVDSSRPDAAKVRRCLPTGPWPSRPAMVSMAFFFLAGGDQVGPAPPGSPSAVEDLRPPWPRFLRARVHGRTAQCAGMCLPEPPPGPGPGLAASPSEALALQPHLRRWAPPRNAEEGTAVEGRGLAPPTVCGGPIRTVTVASRAVRLEASTANPDAKRTSGRRRPDRRFTSPRNLTLAAHPTPFGRVPRSRSAVRQPPGPSPPTPGASGDVAGRVGEARHAEDPTGTILARWGSGC